MKTARGGAKTAKKAKKGGTRTVISSTTPRRGKLASGLQHVPDEAKDKKPPGKAEVRKPTVSENAALGSNEHATAAQVAQRNGKARSDAPPAGSNRAPAVGGRRESVNRQTGEVVQRGVGPEFDGARVFIPTHIGAVCSDSSEALLAHQVVFIHPDDRENGCLLTSTDGHMMAVVMAEYHVDGDGDCPREIPREFAKPAKGAARELKSGVGPESNLFGQTRVWVDLADNRFEPVPAVTQAYPFADVLPAIDMSWRMVGINVVGLLKLAKAINSQESPIGTGACVLAIPPEGRSGPMVAIGDVGAGVIMQVVCNAEMDGTRYRELRRRAVAAGRHIAAEVDPNPDGRLNFPTSSPEGEAPAPATSESDSSTDTGSSPTAGQSAAPVLAFRDGVTRETMVVDLDIDEGTQRILLEAGYHTVANLEDRKIGHGGARGRLTAIKGINAVSEHAINEALYGQSTVEDDS